MSTPIVIKGAKTAYIYIAERKINHMPTTKSKSKDEMNVLVTLNSGYVPQLCVMLHSLVRCNPTRRIRLFVLHSSLTADDFDRIGNTLLRAEEKYGSPRLGERCKVVTVNADALDLSNAPVTDRYPAEMYYRIFAARFMPEDVERVLYLDPDIIVNGSLGELYDCNMSGYLFAAASHVGTLMNKINEVRLDMDENAPYINSGVMLMNIALLRKKQNTDEVFAYIESHKKVLCLPDQDVISALYGPEIFPLNPYRYNMTERLFAFRVESELWKSLEKVRESSVIIHYCGRNKPWKKGYIGKLDVFYNEELKMMEDEN